MQYVQNEKNYQLPISNFKNKMIKKNKGFTLFELLVSISIIAILTAVGIVSFSSAQKKARDARRVQDMDTLAKAAEMYYSINSATYPTTFGVGVTWPGVLDTFPMDPKGVAYSGPSVQDTTDFCFCAFIEGKSGNSIDNNCDFNGVGDKQWYCVKNQQ